MLERISQFAMRIQRSADFECVYARGEPADSASLERLGDAFSACGITLPKPLSELYRAYDGFTLRWTYKRVTHPDFLTSGNTSIPPISTLLASIQYAPQEPALFDYISDLAQVEIRLDSGDAKLWYHQDDPELDAALRLDIGDYLEMLDRSCGLYPWQEFFLEASQHAMNPVLRDKFFSDLRLLFNDVDPAIFGPVRPSSGD